MTIGKQRWNAAEYARNARFVSELGMPLIELLAPKAGEDVLDLGCGDGALTVKLAELGCVVTGIDASEDMVAAARQLGIDARVANAADLCFDQEFDGVFSNAALHWIPEAGDVVRGVRRALKPGGRFVAEFGGFGNVATIAAAVNEALEKRGLAVPNPWYFPNVQQYQQLLAENGFTVDLIELFPRLTPLPGHINDWIETFYRPFLDEVSTADWPDFRFQVCKSLENQLRDSSDTWHVDYVRLRFVAAMSA